jgi:Predicted 3'-5' exonuclease related to the exonuclease domain of PolB
VAFVDKIAQLKPQLVTFNGSSFDLPVVRYRAMVHKVPAAGLSVRPYFHRYTATLMMPSIFVTCCLRLHPEQKRVCMSFAGSWDCRVSPTPSTVRTLIDIFAKDASEKSRSIARVM